MIKYIINSNSWKVKKSINEANQKNCGTVIVHFYIWYTLQLHLQLIKSKKKDISRHVQLKVSTLSTSIYVICPPYMYKLYIIIKLIYISSSKQQNEKNVISSEGTFLYKVIYF